MSMLSQDISEVPFTLHSTGEALDKACSLIYRQLCVACLVLLDMIYIPVIITEMYVNALLHNIIVTALFSA